MRDILKQSELFSGLSDEAIDQVCAAARKRTARKNEVIFYEDDEAVAFFIVCSGKVKIYKTSAEGKEQILRISGENQAFAEAAMFAGGRYPASAQALEDSELVIIQRNQFIAELKQNPELAMSLIANLSGLLRKLTSLVEGLSLTDVTSRLAYHLVGLLQEHKTVIVLDEKKATLASELGTIPETLSRSFSKLIKEKIIEVDGSTIKVLDLGRLCEAAGK